MDLEKLYYEVKRHIEAIDFAKLWRGFKPLKFALYTDKVCFLTARTNVLNTGISLSKRTPIKKLRKSIKYSCLKELFVKISAVFALVFIFLGGFVCVFRAPIQRRDRRRTVLSFGAEEGAKIARFFAFLPHWRALDFPLVFAKNRWKEKA